MSRLHFLGNSHGLGEGFLIRQQKLTGQPLFSNRLSSLFHLIVKFVDIFVHNICLFFNRLIFLVIFTVFAKILISIVIIVVFLLVFNLILLRFRIILIFSSAWVSTTLGVQLVKDVLDLLFELLITIFHQIGEHFMHTKRMCLLLECLPGENGIQGAVDMGSNNHIFMFNQL